jgi:N-acetyl-anhydromuramyl-L-alanine amidase AmpD
MRIQERPSPNWNERPSAAIVDCIVLHADAAPTVASSLSWILSKQSRVSYHYLLGRLGDVYECVAPERRAWHAGVSAFLGRPNCNDYSIGVSFGNLCDNHEPYRPDQIESGVQLCVDLIRQWPAITVDRITTHSAVALPLGRKRDPGGLFPLVDFLAEVRSRLDAQ